MERIVDGRKAGGQAGDPAQLLEQLKREHAELEARLAEIETHLSLTAEEQVERVRIKKLKLAKKDRMLSLQAVLDRRKAG